MNAMQHQKPRPADLPDEPITRLLAVMAWLRHPSVGCPWDRDQTFETIAPYTIEEAYEVADAIARRSLYDLREELGDLLLQVVYHSRIAEELGEFAFADVASAIATKMIERHPHVFGDVDVAAADARTLTWEARKAFERNRKASRSPGEAQQASVLDGVALALPALLRADKLQKRAAGVGFDWPTVAEVFAKIDEELGEVRAELANGADHDRIEGEIGDVLFAVTNLARHLKIDPEAALRRTNSKFDRRFRFIEVSLQASGKTPKEATLDEMESLWKASKQQENQ